MRVGTTQSTSFPQHTSQHEQDGVHQAHAQSPTAPTDHTRTCALLRVFRMLRGGEQISRKWKSGLSLHIIMQLRRCGGDLVFHFGDMNYCVLPPIPHHISISTAPRNGWKWNQGNDRRGNMLAGLRSGFRGGSANP